MSYQYLGSKVVARAFACSAIVAYSLKVGSDDSVKMQNEATSAIGAVSSSVDDNRAFRASSTDAIVAELDVIQIIPNFTKLQNFKFVI